MPVKVRIKGGEYQFIYPGTGKRHHDNGLTPVNIPGINEDNVEVDSFNYYIGILKE